MRIAIGAAFGFAIVGVAVIVLLSGQGADANSVYRQKLTASLAPVLVANRALSSSLQSLSGIRTTAARIAAGQAQTAIVGARGAVAILTVPRASTQLSQQAQQAITLEGGYLQAVSATLAAPTSANAAALQPLATGASSALVPLESVAPGAQASLTGTESLSRWAVRPRKRVIKPPTPTTTTTTTTTTIVPSTTTASPPVSSGTDCGGGLHAGPVTTCAFAENVRSAWEAAPGVVNTLQVYSPVTGLTYTMTCAPAGTGISCSGGNNSSVSW